MELHQKILLLTVAPPTIAILAIILTVRHQSTILARHERQSVESTYPQVKEAKLRSYVRLTQNAITPLFASGQNDDSARDEATRDEAMRTPVRLDSGTDGYFFLYGSRGHNLMHPCQPELVGRDLWDLTDSGGQSTIQKLVATAQAGGGFVRYIWDKPSAYQSVPRLGCVEPIPQWDWMMGIDLYLDDIEQALCEIDRRAWANIDQTLAWVVSITAISIPLVVGSELTLNVGNHRQTDAKLRQLVQQMVRSQGDEHARVLRELRDGISQVFVSTKLLLRTAHGHLEASAASPTSTERMGSMLHRAFDRLSSTPGEVRRVSHDPRPALLDNLGLAAVLKPFVRETREAHEDNQPGSVIVLELVGPSVRLPDACNAVLFRIAREVVSNIERHAT